MTRATRPTPTTTPVRPHVPGRARTPVRGVALRPVLIALGSTVLLASCLLIVVGGVRTATGRFAGSTANEGSLLTAAAVDLRLGADPTGPGDPGGASVTRLAIDASNLLPGDEVRRCLVVGYTGDLDGVGVRLVGRLDGGTGLDRHLETTISLGAGSDPDCTDFGASSEVFRGTLRALADRHGGFEQGIVVLDAADDGDAVTVEVRVELLDDDAAQGLDTGFWLEIEARP